ncbi:MAG: type II toxin-antitoxin system Phd/YefM family antitoxin [Treponemataceae bacterium]|nr:type II toxin-antitoxin system Phd/YefM family antitoxin [Treponemataceae bacterium]
MVSFARNEIISSTNIVRQFSAVLKSLADKTRQKVVVIRNNEMEAVLLPVDEYERLVEAAEQCEYAEIAVAVAEREATPESAYIPFADVLAVEGIGEDEL